MPKQRIREIDLTGNITASGVVSTVYIPVRAYGINNNVNDFAWAPCLCKTTTDLDAYIPETWEGQSVTLRNSTAYKISRYLIQRGMYVLSQVIKNDSGEDSGLVPDTEWNKLKDKSKYDIRFITTGDFEGYDANAVDCAARRGDCTYLADYLGSSTIETKYLRINTEPGDWDTKYTDYYYENPTWTKIEDLEGGRPSVEDYKPNKYYVALGEINSTYQAQLLTISVAPSDWENATSKYYTKTMGYTQFTTTAFPSAPTFSEYKVYESLGEFTQYDAFSVRTYFNDKWANYPDDKKEDFKYAAAFVPNIKTKNQDIIKNPETAELELKAAYGYLLSFVNSISKSNAEWLAVAGSFRGSIPELSSVLYEYSNAECEILQARAELGEVELDGEDDNVGIAINPIATVRPFGYIIWGNRTLLKGTGTLKATNFLNIRQLISTINKELYNASRKYTFEQNTNALWANFQNELAPTLDKMKSGNGILDYRWRKGTTTKKARLVAVLRIIPIEALEDFDLTIELADSLEVVE